MSKFGNLLSNNPTFPFPNMEYSSNNSVFLITINDKPIGYTNTEIKAKIQIKRIGKSLCYNDSRIDLLDKVIYVYKQGYFLESLIYTITYEKINKLS